MLQWFPGHMNKTRREISETLRVVDIIIELIDARIPLSSQNPLFDEVAKDKKRLYLLTKSSLAEDTITKKWETYYNQNNKVALIIDAISGYNVNKIVSTCREILKEERLRDQKRGLKERAIRAMVIGVPNVGKSTLINRLVNKRATKVGNKPGITRNLQWIRINKDLELLDTPGVLWPKFADQKQAYHLALTGAIKDDILKKEELANYLIDYLKKYSFKSLENRYELKSSDLSWEILEKIRKARGIPESASEQLYEVIIHDFRQGAFGRISLDRFEDD